VTGDGSVQFHNNGAGNALIIGGNITANNFTGTIRSRGGGSNAFLGTINIPSGSLVKHEGGPLLINAPGNNWLSTTINNYILKIGANNALPPAGPVTFGNNGNTALLDLAGFSQQVSGLAIATDNAANRAKIFSSSVASDSTLVFGGTGSTSFTGTIDDNDTVNPGTPKVNLTVSSGALSLVPVAGRNAYGGATTVNGGAQPHGKVGPGWRWFVAVADGGTFGGGWRRRQLARGFLRELCAARVARSMWTSPTSATRPSHPLPPAACPPMGR
jgi:hypothetical protein